MNPAQGQGSMQQQHYTDESKHADNDNKTRTQPASNVTANPPPPQAVSPFSTSSPSPASTLTHTPRRQRHPQRHTLTAPSIQQEAQAWKHGSGFGFGTGGAHGIDTATGSETVFSASLSHPPGSSPPTPTTFTPERMHTDDRKRHSHHSSHPHSLTHHHRTPFLHTPSNATTAAASLPTSASHPIPVPSTVANSQISKLRGSHPLPFSPFTSPSLTCLSRSRLLHVLERQMNVSKRNDDAASAAHYSALISCIRSLYLNGTVLDFSFINGSCVSPRLLASLSKHAAAGMGRGGTGGTATLTPIQLLELMIALRSSPPCKLRDPDTAMEMMKWADDHQDEDDDGDDERESRGKWRRPSQLPPCLHDIDSDEHSPSCMNMSGVMMSDRSKLCPFIYHRSLSLTFLLLVLHLHRLALSRILYLLGGIDDHLHYWLNHRDISSLPLPYRIGSYVQWWWRGGSVAVNGNGNGNGNGNAHQSGENSSSNVKGDRLSSEPSRTQSQRPDADDGCDRTAMAARLNPYKRYKELAARNSKDLLRLKKSWTEKCGRISRRMFMLQQWLNDSFSNHQDHHPDADADADSDVDDDMNSAPYTPASTSASACASTSDPSSRVDGGDGVGSLLLCHVSTAESFFRDLYADIVGRPWQEEEEDEDNDEDEDDAVIGGEPDVCATNTYASLYMSGLRSSPPPSSSCRFPRVDRSIHRLLSLLSHCEEWLVAFERSFSARFEREIAARRMPHHVWRQWPYYLTALVGVSGMTYCAVRYPHKLMDALRSAWQSTKFFFIEHLQEPLVNMAQTVTETFNDRSLFSTTLSSLQQSKQHLATMLTDFARHHSAQLAAYENRPESDYVASIPSRAALGDMDLCMRTYLNELEHPLNGLLFGDLLRGLLIQVQKAKTDAEAAMLSADQILKANALNFDVLATIPFLMLAYAAAALTNRYIARSSWSNTTVKHKVQQARTILAEIEQILILHASQSSCPHSSSSWDSSSSSSSSFPLRSHVHTLTLDEWSSLRGQAIEAEDERLRRNQHQHQHQHQQRHRPSRATYRLKTTHQLDGARHDKRTRASARTSSRDRYKHTAGSTDLVNTHATSHTPSSPGTCLCPFHSHTHTSLSASFVCSHHLSDESYGHILLLLHHLSDVMSDLPLTSPSSTYRYAPTASVSAESREPCLRLRKDLMILAAVDIKPDQKLSWIQHMRHAHAFLAATT